MGREMAPENPSASESEQELAKSGKDLIDNLIEKDFGSKPLVQLLAALQAESEKLDSMRQRNDGNSFIVQGRVDALKRLIEKRRAEGESDEQSE